MARKKSFINDRNLAILTLILWALVFVVYLINVPDATVMGMSKPFAYSLFWWVIVLLLFIVWSYLDLQGGEQ
ncbi:MAG: hypothetical protein DRJ64_02845 [Thermoprotei archaeon]|nr:MAG: hypothetical protein DRJ64_02845 [Thermoprotei archaeon]